MEGRSSSTQNVQDDSSKGPLAASLCRGRGDCSDDVVPSILHRLESAADGVDLDFHGEVESVDV
jgi:hypothetical protein